MAKFLFKRADTLVVPSHVPLRSGETVPVRTLLRCLLIGSDNDRPWRWRGTRAVRCKCVPDERARPRVGLRKHLVQKPERPPRARPVNDRPGLVENISGRHRRCRNCARFAWTPSFTLRTAAGVQTLRNHNRLLGVYPGMGPAKTGWTFSSKHTYAASATRGGHELYLILLHSPNKWRDAVALFDFGFEQCRREGNGPAAALTNSATRPADEHPGKHLATFSQ